MIGDLDSADPDDVERAVAERRTRRPPPGRQGRHRPRARARRGPRPRRDRGDRRRRRRRPARPLPRQPPARHPRGVRRPRPRRARRRHPRRRRAHGAPARRARSAASSRCCPSAGPPAASPPPGCAGPLTDAELTARQHPRREQRDRHVARRPSACGDGVLLAIQPTRSDPDAKTRSSSRWSWHARDRRARPRARPAAARPTRPSRSSPTTRSRCRSPCCARSRSETGMKVQVLKNGDAGAALNQAILTKDAPLGDAFFGVDNTFLTRALRGEGLRRLPPEGARLRDAEPAARPDRARHARRLRRRLRQLRQEVVRVSGPTRRRPRSTTSPKPAYKDQLVVENPATSSTGLAFVVATVAKYGDRLARLLGPAPRQRRPRRRRLGAGVQRRVLRRGREQGRPPARRELRVEPAGRGVLRRPAADDRADGVAARDVLPPGRVRRGAARRRAPGRRRASSSTSC